MSAVNFTASNDGLYITYVLRSLLQVHPSGKNYIAPSFLQYRRRLKSRTAGAERGELWIHSFTKTYISWRKYNVPAHAAAKEVGCHYRSRTVTAPRPRARAARAGLCRGRPWRASLAPAACCAMAGRMKRGCCHVLGLTVDDST